MFRQEPMGNMIPRAVAGGGGGGAIAGGGGGAAAGGGAACCGAGSCDGGGAVSTMSYVGQGCGDYTMETTYRYVGNGAGEMQVVTIPQGGFNFCWINILWLAVIPFLWMLIQPSTTLTTTLPDIQPGLPAECEVYGDPHIDTFDGKHADYYSPGEYWIVKSDTVKVQARYMPTQITKGLAVTKEVAISGSFMNNDKLWITGDQATFNGMPILTTFPSSFRSADGSVDIQYNSIGDTLQKGRAGKPMHVLHVTLPNNVKMQINRWDEVGEGMYINLRIMMSAVPGQDGQCGNFNGNAEDDARVAVRARLGTNGVDASELILPGAKTPISPTGRPDINDCPQDRLEFAKAHCKQKANHYQPGMGCLIDVCFGGKDFARQDTE